MALFTFGEAAREEENRQNRKLEAVAFLRNSNARNRQRMLQVRSILYGEPYAPENEQYTEHYANKYPDKYTNNYTDQYSIIEKPEDGIRGSLQEESSFWLSFIRRCIICGAVLALLYMGNPSENTFASKYKKEIKSFISEDYSEKLFDFIQQIPYTFDYEKINVEG